MKKMFSILLIVMLLVSTFGINFAFAETNPYIFTHDTVNKYWHRSPHRINESTPPAMYHLISNGESFITYCCDFDTNISPGTNYKRVNLEDADYYTEEDAKHIRFILENGYWSGRNNLANLELNIGMTGLTTAEALTATQAAIWTFANNNCVIQPYGKTANVDGTYAIDITTVDVNENATEGTAERIIALYNYLCEGTLENNSIITKFVNEPVITISLNEENNYDINVSYEVVGPTEGLTLTAILSNDNGIIETLTDNTIFLNKTKEELELNAKIDLVLQGNIIVNRAVYFYEPEGGRGSAQSMVGYGEGITPVNCAIAVAVPALPEPPVEPEPEPEPIIPEPEPEPEPIIPWYPPYIPEPEPEPIIPEPEPEIIIPELEPEPEIPDVIVEEIPESEIEEEEEEEIPLATVPKTGDEGFLIWLIVCVMSLLGIFKFSKKIT